MRTRVYNNKEQIFCDWRHRWVRLTPEEWIRQQLLHRLVEQLDFPTSRIAVEVPFEMSNVQSPMSNARKRYRADAVIYDQQMQPLLIIECKAESVPLTQKTLDQAITYNRKLNVPYLLLYNGAQSYLVHGNNIYTSGLPRYSDLLRSE